MAKAFKKVSVIVAVMLIFVFPVLAQTNLYVDGSVSSSGVGTTWGTAYKYLSEALDVANAGSADYNINIAQGTYYPTSGGSTVTSLEGCFYELGLGLKILTGVPSVTLLDYPLCPALMTFP